MTFYQSVRPILLHFTQHDFYVCLHLIVNFNSNILCTRVYVCLHLIVNFIFNLLCTRVKNFSLLFNCFKLAYLTFYQYVRPILLYVIMHDFYVCLHLIVNFISNILCTRV